MIHSMTGYGAGRGRLKTAAIDVEVRSVNGRFLDLRFNMPKECMALEADARERVQAVLARGTVTVMLNVKSVPGATKLMVDEKHARAVIARLKQVAKAAGLKAEGSLDTLLSVPGLVRIDEEAYDAERMRAPFLAALDQALKQLVQARRREGAALAADMKKRIGRVQVLAKKIEAEVPQIVERFNQRLTKRLDELKAQAGVAFDPVRILTETGVFSERTDIAEELTRMHSHLGQLAAVVAESGSVGKRVDFILQELFREITTVANKANCAEVSTHAIAIKEQLEKLREQVQNIE